MPGIKQSPASHFPSSIGRAGKLTLDYRRDASRTVLARSTCQSPWHLLPPIHLDETGAAYTLLLNPSGGLVGGDHLSIDLTVGADAHVLISTPGANRVYRSQSEESVQAARLSVASGGILEWLPEPTIPFAGARFRQSIEATLARGATLFLWDALASGRVARGERWAFESLSNEIRVTTESGRCLLERYEVKPGVGHRVGLAHAWNYLGSIYLISDQIGGEGWKRLEETIAEALERCRDRILGGVSEPAVQGLTVKILTRSAPDLSSIMETIWAAARAQLWGLPVPALRRY